MRLKLTTASAVIAATLSLTGCSSEKTEQAQVTVGEPEVTETETAAVETDSVPVPDWMPADATVTPSGLGIVIENPGDETRATPTSPVTLHYRGRLTDGTVFDSSYDRGTPATFMATQVVPGFGEGIQMVGKGGKATLYLPSDLAYGSRGVPQAGIAPGANLIFDIEIIDIAQ